MIRILSGLRRKPGRGYPFLDLSPGTGDGSPWSAACFCWKHLQSTWPRSDFGGEGAAAAAGRGAPVGCLLLLEIPAVCLAAKRLRRREGRCSGRTGVPGRLPASIGSACCPLGRGAASAAEGPLRRQDEGPRSSAYFCWKCLLSAWPRSGFGGKRAAAAAGRRSPGRLPASVESTCCPARRLAALQAGVFSAVSLRLPCGKGAGARRATEGLSAETSPERIIPGQYFSA